VISTILAKVADSGPGASFRPRQVWLPGAVLGLGALLAVEAHAGAPGPAAAHPPAVPASVAATAPEANPHDAALMQALTTMNVRGPMPTGRILVTGQGAVPERAGLSAAQKHLLGLRAAKLDAYRNMAELIGGFTVYGSTKVSDLAAQSDQVRSLVDHYLRGVALVSSEHLGEGLFEVTMELVLRPEFLASLERWAYLTPPPQDSDAARALYGRAIY